MKVGDLVRYGDWYTGKSVLGIILEADCGVYDSHYLVAWPDGFEWETYEELEVVSEGR